ncbi:hypothetical protein GCM10011494_31360 [Novosphingobium endophyticum]|uniref:Uncharacterized protein n=1 Tax=Novosphingobium endophyticum TaxID=1955250 RepID=A0A916TUC3_9SPHN|nr:hypothetical protein [Novosphingobium endophyticum]GGC10403.1 hypothetical protein GCM10011494_31360 [Novosphingobium endophyticum]
MALNDVLIDGMKIVGGGLVASTVTLWVNGRRSEREVTRTARALATRLVPIFEAYARTCAEIRGIHLASEREDPYDFSGVQHVPELQELPVDEQGWRAIDGDLGARAQTFHMHVYSCRQLVKATAEYGDADDIEVAVETQATELGAMAWSIGCDLRDRYDLPPAPPDWKYMQHFLEEEARLAKQLEERRAEMRELNSILEEEGIEPNLV